MTIREINQAIEEGQSLKQIAQAYGEIATIKIRKIRAAVEKNRSFLKEIATVYRIVKQQSYVRKLAVKKSKKTVSILLTSNFRFYGNIDMEVTRFFLENTPKIQTDRIVVGKTANHFLQVMKYFNSYQLLNFKADLPTPEELSQLGQLIKEYQQVLVFYPELSTLLVQKPIVSDITQSDLLTATPTTTTTNYVIFEPELLKILEFFDNQIITLLLEQTFFESELSRTASRILSMDQAQIEAKRFIEGQGQLKAHTLRVEESSHLLENLTSLIAINKEKYN